MSTPPPRKPDPIKDLPELKAALQLAVGLELSTIPVYLTALYSIKDGTNTEAAQTIRSVVMEEMLHMTLAANVLNALGEKPSTKPVTFRTWQNLKPVPEYPARNPVVSGIGELALAPFSPGAVASFVRIEDPFHGARSLTDVERVEDKYATIGEFYAAISTALEATSKVCKESDFKNRNQVAATHYYGGAGRAIQVTSRSSALDAIKMIVDEGEGMPEPYLRQQAKKVTDSDRLNNGWQMYSHYARFRELQTGRRFRSDQKAKDTPKGSLVPIDYDAVHPAFYVKYDAAGTPGSPEGVALNRFDLAYTRVVDDLYLAFAGGKRKVEDKLAPKGEREVDPLLLAVHGMRTLKDRAVALMRTPDPARPERRLCPRFHYAATPGERKKLEKLTEEMAGGVG
ncbi:ferritin-like protein [Streptomyces niveiscabiei]|uniref:ferritin-like domain-containing protein n=1 Tax=Streptomyces niveiscabiei TaxID=164115 RepID=UPI0029BF9CBE|nr:ferritin-like protein [Streptomyces niveiscabiei]MDX3380573.1 ferritin-like protein [Streptomyces niveiscabiei]